MKKKTAVWLSYYNAVSHTHKISETQMYILHYAQKTSIIFQEVGHILVLPPSRLEKVFYCDLHFYTHFVWTVVSPWGVRRSNCVWLKTIKDCERFSSRLSQSAVQAVINKEILWSDRRDVGHFSDWMISCFLKMIWHHSPWKRLQAIRGQSSPQGVIFCSCKVPWMFWFSKCIE